MKISNLKMYSFMLLAVLFAFSACSKDDDPADNDFFTGVYNGRVSFNGGGSTIAEQDGSVRVNKVGDNYTFNFSGDIPSLGDIAMEKGDNNTLRLSNGEFGTISIDASTLRIAFNRDGQTWTANCTR